MLRRDFREKLIKRYRQCQITGFTPLICDAAHIIPRTFCKSLSSVGEYNVNNGLLLCKGIHCSFDQFLWTFDLYDRNQNIEGGLDESHPSEWTYLPIIPLNPSANLLINLYVRNQDGSRRRFKVHKSSLVYLEIHYRAFLAVNYAKVDISTCYDGLLNRFYTTILKYKLSCDKYLIVSVGKSPVWVDSEFLTEDLKLSYHQRQDLLLDPDWVSC